MELYRDYVKERLGRDFIEDPEKKAFVIYEIEGEELYVVDIYVDPKHRHEGILFEILNDLVEMALKKGCTYATGTVVTGTNGDTESLLYILRWGFKLLECRNNVIILKKDLIKKGK